MWREGFNFCDASTTFCNSNVPQHIKKHELAFPAEFRPTYRRFLYNTKKYFYFLENPHHLNLYTSSVAVFWHAAIIIFHLTSNTHAIKYWEAVLRAHLFNKNKFWRCYKIISLDIEGIPRISRIHYLDSWLYLNLVSLLRFYIFIFNIFILLSLHYSQVRLVIIQSWKKEGLAISPSTKQSETSFLWSTADIKAMPWW